MRQIRVYTASKLCHAELWKKLRVLFPEVYFTARWPYLVGQIEDQPAQAEQFWQDDLADIARSDVVLVYTAGREEHLRGALVEAGMGIALGKIIMVIGDHPDYGTWQYHSSVYKYPTVEVALQRAEQMTGLKSSCL